MYCTKFLKKQEAFNAMNEVLTWASTHDHLSKYDLHVCDNHGEVVEGNDVPIKISDNPDDAWDRAMGGL